jgi:quinolinate synthase
MAMNGLENLANVLDDFKNEVFVEPEVGQKARRSIERMLDFAATHGVGPAAARATPGDPAGIGPA